MKEIHICIKKGLKLLPWLVLGVVILLTILAGLIQIPYIQTRIIHEVTSYVSQKTQTKIEINRVSIGFPKSVIIDGIFLEDKKQDTLIYVGELNVGISFTDLIHNKITISHLLVNNLNAHIYNTDTDSLFNYNFLISAFSDTSSTATKDTTTNSPWTFSLAELKLHNIRFDYNDEFGGMKVSAKLQQINLEMEKIDLAEADYGVNELIIEGLIAQIQLSESQYTNTNNNDTHKEILPKINAHLIRINQSSLSYNNTITTDSLAADINNFNLKNTSLNLQQSSVVLDEFTLAHSKVYFYTPKTDSVSQAKTATDSVAHPNNWKVKLSTVNFEDNALTFRQGNTYLASKTFNPDNLDYNHVTFIGKDIEYSTENTKGSIIEFSTQDQNGFSITQFTTNFTMDSHALIIKNLSLQTNHSSIIGEVRLAYSSLQSLQDSIGFLVTNINLKELKLSNADLLYFSPDLAKQPYFQKRSAMATLSGKIEGPINNLTGKNLKLNIGHQTILTTDFSIKGLPQVETTQFDFPNLRLISGKNDINSFAKPFLPEEIEIPEYIDFNIIFKGGLSHFKSSLLLQSSFGSAKITALLDEKENFSGKVNLNKFNFGSLLKDTAMFGPVSLNLETAGHGLDKAQIQAQIKGEATSLYFNHYTYGNLTITGQASSEQFEGNISLNDKNIIFDFQGLVNLKPDNEHFKFKLNLKGADLKALQVTPNNIQIGLVASADLTRNSIQNVNGNATISQIIVVDNGEQFKLDSVLISTSNTLTSSIFNIDSPLFGLHYEGTSSPMDIPSYLTEWANHYFPFTDTSLLSSLNKHSHFDFEIQLYNHPLITQVLFPKLTEFEPGPIRGSFDSDSMHLNVNATIRHITYDNTDIENFTINILSNKNVINYQFSSNDITNSQVTLENLNFGGKIADSKILATLSLTNEDGSKDLHIETQLDKEKDNFRLFFNPQQFYLMNERWDISDDNYLLFGSKGFKIHNLNISKLNSLISINSINNTYNDDLNITIKNFKLYNIFGIIETDSNLIKGTVNGNIILKRVHESYGFLADAQIENMEVMEIPVGNISVNAATKDNTKFDLKLNLSGAENEMAIAGYFIPDGGEKSLHLQAEIPSLSMKTIQAFSMGQIKEASGTVTGNFLITGIAAHPNISGELTFKNTLINPTALNNQFELKQETIQIKNDGIHFDQFTLLDKNQCEATIDGSVKMTNFNDFTFALQVNSNDFLLINTTVKDNKNFYGKIIIDSKININGALSKPVINAKIKMKNGSNITIAVPESQLTTNKGQGIVEFTYHSKLNPILEKVKTGQTQYSGLKGFDLSSIIEIDKLAKLRLLMDPTSNDSLVVQGEAALSFTMDRSGKMSLTGAYELADGSYVVSLESLIKKRFVIEKGSTITWNGDPMDAGISINAIYSVRASPNNLIGEQTAGVTDADKNASMQRQPFLVILKIRGKILKPEIGFEIQLPPEDKGLLGGAVEAKLIQLNQDPSELNKQVFALLMLGRFVQETPLDFGVANGTTNMVRATVSSFLSNELNKWSSKLVPGVELNFDVNSYNEYESNQTIGRTQVDIGLKKQLFDERLTVQIGGVVDVEGAKAKENSVNNITSDVSVEYELTKDGRYRLVGFSHNQYEGAIEGQVVETGVGLIYQKDFDKWKDFFKKLTPQK